MNEGEIMKEIEPITKIIGMGTNIIHERNYGHLLYMYNENEK